MLKFPALPATKIELEDHRQTRTKNTRCCFSCDQAWLGTRTQKTNKQTHILKYKDAAALAANIDTQTDRQTAADVAAVTAPHKLHIGKKHTLLI